MIKLTVPEAIEIVKKSLEDVKSDSHLRLGQQIWNNLGYTDHKDLTDKFQATDKDFFYWVDNQEVLDCFYKNYVDYDK